MTGAGGERDPTFISEGADAPRVMGAGAAGTGGGGGGGGGTESENDRSPLSSARAACLWARSRSGGRAAGATGRRHNPSGACAGVWRRCGVAAGAMDEATSARVVAKAIGRT